MEEQKQGLKVIPMGERKCIWMDAGVVSYKLCTNHYQCNTCEFDLAMSNRAKKDKLNLQENTQMDGFLPHTMQNYLKII